MLLAQLVVIGQLIGQAGDVRQQVTDRHVVPPVARERGQELLHAVIELKLPLIEQGHDGRHVDRLGNGAEQEHRVARGRLAEVARERLVPLNHVQHGRVHLLRRRGPLEHFGRVIPPLPAQGREQGGSGRNGQGRPKKRASPHHTGSSASRQQQRQEHWQPLEAGFLARGPFPIVPILRESVSGAAATTGRFWGGAGIGRSRFDPRKPGLNPPICGSASPCTRHPRFHNPVGLPWAEAAAQEATCSLGCAGRCGDLRACSVKSNSGQVRRGLRGKTGPALGTSPRRRCNCDRVLVHCQPSAGTQTGECGRRARR